LPAVPVEFVYPPSPITPLPGATVIAAQSVQFISVSGAPPGRDASVTVQTSPGARCSIVYTTPNQTVSRASGLEPRTADAGGRVSWTWLIDGNTTPGMGTVAVNCGASTVTAAITVG
jgi:hypothetical protein